MKNKVEKGYTIEDLEELLDSVPYEVWIKGKDGVYKYINSISAEKMGFNKEEVIGKTDYELRPYEMAKSCDESDKVVLNSGMNSLHEEKRMIGEKEVWYKIYKTMLNNKGNNAGLLGGAAKDMTDEIGLKKDKQNLERVIEMESLKTEFFGNLSHEFKTPLNIIISTVQVILNYVIADEKDIDIKKLKKYINGIKQNSYRLLKLANNMIDITKIDKGFYDIHIDNYNIVDVVENIVQSVSGHIEDNKRNIVFDTTEEEIITACDPDQIERIILNLLSNSIKFTSFNGHIFVEITVSDDCSKVIIKVRNDGPALSEEDTQKIFRRFTRSEDLLTKSVEGSGIGLALVKSLVELHKGKIYVNTEVKNGTEFCMEFPIMKIMNSRTSNVSAKNLNSKVEMYNIEFSDIYTLD